MRIIIWHGYLLGGTGSNVYTRSLARTWSNQGHDVVVLCQEPHPGRYDVGSARVVRPQLNGPLPVFVLDRYADATPVRLPDMAAADRDAFVAANVEALRAQGPADFLLANHVLLGAPVAAASQLPSIVKAHGSELEFAMRGSADLAAWAARTLVGVRAVVAGSQHIVGVLEDVVGRGAYSERVHVVPPGVDTEALRPRDRATALAGLLDECRRDGASAAGGDDQSPDPANAERLADFLHGDAPTVLYVGKLSREKGVSLLLDALRGLDARTVVAGSGPERAALQAQSRGERVLFTGPLEHRHLAHLWPLADVSVTPSVFPEAFGMVAAEAAACGSPPLVAGHSGLAEVAAAVGQHYPHRLRHLASFTPNDVEDLRSKLQQLVTLDAATWRQLSQAARRTAVAHWGWTSVADRLADLATDGCP